MAAACRRMAVDPKLLEQIDYDLPLDPNFDNSNKSPLKWHFLYFLLL